MGNQAEGLEQQNADHWRLGERVQQEVRKDQVRLWTTKHAPRGSLHSRQLRTLRSMTGEWTDQIWAQASALFPRGTHNAFSREKSV